MRKKRSRRNKSGIGVVEVVVALLLLSMSFAMGMAGIQLGASLVTQGAGMKHERDAAVVDMQAAGTATVTVDNLDAIGSKTFTVNKYTNTGGSGSGNYIMYRP